MSTKKDYISNFSDVLKRLHQISGKENEYEIAEILGFKKDTFAARKSRGSIPEKEIKILCVSKGWNFEWVMNGDGDMYVKERPILYPDLSKGALIVIDEQHRAMVKLMESAPGREAELLALVKGYLAGKKVV